MRLNKVPDWVWRLMVADIKNKLEDGPMESKKWFKSKRIWTGVVITAAGAYETAALQFSLPPIPPFVYSLLGAFGIYLNKTSDKLIK